MWFAKNSDRHPDEPQVISVFEPRVAGEDLRTQYLTIPDANASAFCGSQPTWLWGCEHGVNQHGVAIGNEKIWTTTDPRDLPDALLGMDVVRLVLERARTADEALFICTSLLEQYGQGGTGEPHDNEPYFSSFLIADAHRGWVVETNNRSWVSRPVEIGAAISNRVSLTTDWVRASPDIEPGTDFDSFRETRVPTGIADHRLEATGLCVARPNISARSIAATLRDHGSTYEDFPGDIGEDWSGFTVCMHRPEVHAQTTASMIVNIPAGDAPLRVWACLGNPCLSIYVPAFPPGIAPELADPEQWQRFKRLRERVDAEPYEATEVRAVLAAAEDAFWNAADAAVVSGSARARESFARDAYRPVDEALRRLGV
jgi:hypothetical protein